MPENFEPPSPLDRQNTPNADADTSPEGIGAHLKELAFRVAETVYAADARMQHRVASVVQSVHSGAQTVIDDVDAGSLVEGIAQKVQQVTGPYLEGQSLAEITADQLQRVRTAVGQLDLTTLRAQAESGGKEALAWLRTRLRPKDLQILAQRSGDLMRTLFSSHQLAAKAQLVMVLLGGGVVGSVAAASAREGDPSTEPKGTVEYLEQSTLDLTTDWANPDQWRPRKDITKPPYKITATTAEGDYIKVISINGDETNKTIVVRQAGQEGAIFGTVDLTHYSFCNPGNCGDVDGDIVYEIGKGDPTNPTSTFQKNQRVRIDRRSPSCNMLGRHYFNKEDTKAGAHQYVQQSSDPPGGSGLAPGMEEVVHTFTESQFRAVPEGGVLTDLIQVSDNAGNLGPCFLEVRRDTNPPHCSKLAIIGTSLLVFTDDQVAGVDAQNPQTQLLATLTGPGQYFFTIIDAAGNPGGCTVDIEEPTPGQFRFAPTVSALSIPPVLQPLDPERLDNQGTFFITNPTPESQTVTLILPNGEEITLDIDPETGTEVPLGDIDRTRWTFIRYDNPKVHLQFGYPMALSQAVRSDGWRPLKRLIEKLTVPIDSNDAGRKFWLLSAQTINERGEPVEVQSYTVTNTHPDQERNILFEVRTKDGVPMANNNLHLAVGEQATVLLNEIFPELPPNFQGVVEISSDDGAFVLAAGCWRQIDGNQVYLPRQPHPGDFDDQDFAQILPVQDASTGPIAPEAALSIPPVLPSLLNKEVALFINNLGDQRTIVTFTMPDGRHVTLNIPVRGKELPLSTLGYTGSIDSLKGQTIGHDKSSVKLELQLGYKMSLPQAIRRPIKKYIEELIVSLGSHDAGQRFWVSSVQTENQRGEPVEVQSYTVTNTHPDQERNILFEAYTKDGVPIYTKDGVPMANNNLHLAVGEQTTVLLNDIFPELPPNFGEPIIVKIFSDDGTFVLTPICVYQVDGNLLYVPQQPQRGDFGQLGQGLSVHKEPKPKKEGM